MNEKADCTVSPPRRAHTTEKINSIKGMNDVLPDVSHQWEWLEETVRSVLVRYHYRNIRTPIVELTGLFERGTGQTTDIVEKEMYSFVDSMNGDHLSLRPENTPGVVRAAIEHHLTYNGAQRLYYIGPMFRHERPQRGRYRQFQQIGAEALGFAGPELDVELMLIVQDIFNALGLGQVQVEINSLGLPEERRAHKKALVAYFEGQRTHLDEGALHRLHSNPLRILDSKTPSVQATLGKAPSLLNFLGTASQRHFETVQTLLSACGVDWRINPRLVRGLDYYSHTVFEFISTELGAQATLCGGGRYDGLFQVLGGRPTPAVGWALGVERVLDLLATRKALPEAPAPDAYAVVCDAVYLAQAMPFLQELRRAGVVVQMHAGGEQGFASVKSQFKKAHASGAQFALVFGAEELQTGQIGVKNLRTDGAQSRHGLSDSKGLTKKLLPGLDLN